MDNSKKFKSFFYDKYNKMGDYNFYNYLVTYCNGKISLIEESKYSDIYPHIEMMKYHDMAIKLFRVENYKDNILIKLAKIFRKVAHKVYRLMLKKQLIEKNYLFLTEVKEAA